jgi:hypothetical protein
MTPRIRQPLFLAGALRASVIAAALAAPFGAGAQAPSNPSLNAQLLVGARQGDLAQVERVLAAGASPSSRNRRLARRRCCSLPRRAILPSSRRC